MASNILDHVAQQSHEQRNSKINGLSKFPENSFAESVHKKCKLFYGRGLLHLDAAPTLKNHSEN